MGHEQEAMVMKRWRVAALAGALALVLGGPVHGQTPDGPSSGRGWILGGGISGGRLAFAGGENVALAVGEVVGEVQVGGETLEVRTGELVNAPGDTSELVLLPPGEPSAGFSFHAGYAFSPRVALVLEAEIVGGVRSGFSSAQGGLVLRLWPTSRLWIEGGPASGDLRYGHERTVVEEFTDTGYGVRAGVGITVLQKPKWALDLEARYGTLAFDGFRATSVGVGLSARSRPR